MDSDFYINQLSNLTHTQLIDELYTFGTFTDGSDGSTASDHTDIFSNHYFDISSPRSILKSMRPQISGPSYPNAAGNNNPSIFGAIEGIRTSSGYPVFDPSLDDIAYPLMLYVLGYVGLNNIKYNDHMNVIIHALLHISPLRDALLLSPTNSKNGTELTRRFSVLVKKLENPCLFKAQVSPHEFLQEVNCASGGKFRLEQQGDPVDFPGWLLNRLHKDLGGTKKKNSSIIFSTFQGQLRVDTQQVVVSGDGEANPPPPPPLFQDAIEKNIIPQVSLQSVLAKYDGQTAQESLGNLRRYQCQSLPPYVILHFKRFTKNAFVEEKNPTIVNFPLNGLDLREYLSTPSSKPLLYDLVANVTHESVAGTTGDKINTVWKVRIRAGERWYQMRDLIVKETRKEMIFLGETVLQIWERRKDNSLAFKSIDMNEAAGQAVALTDT
ncbi:hypothetical protein EDD85DRAFT_784087 [Armillaria nabsnona]|nr:hypothetical protein EDD85DRAFT_784087 [Armillaria nabsnona]